MPFITIKRYKNSVLSYQPHMPQVLSANTVLPDTLKVPIISNMLLPAMAAQITDNTGTTTSTSNLKVTPIMREQQPTAIAITPIQTPTTTLTKQHLNVKAKATTNVASTKSSCGTNTNNNANNNEIHNIINSTITTTATTATASNTTTGIVATTCTTATTPTLSVRCTQVPKSPPRWPLRPGVMVHVSSDTKENLAVNRMTLKPTATLANLTVSTVNDSSVSSSTLNNSSAANNTQTTLLNVSRQSSTTMTLGRIGRQSRIQTQDLAFKEEEVVGRELETKDNCNNKQEQLTLSCQTLPSRGKLATKPTTNLTISADTQDIINLTTHIDMPAEEVENTMELKQSQNKQDEDIEAEEEMERNLENPPAETDVTRLNVKLTNLQKVEQFFSNIFFKRTSKANTCRDSQRSHVGLLGGKFWKRSESSTQSPFSSEHRLKGIRSSGSGNNFYLF